MKSDGSPRTKTPRVRRLFFDIETSPNIGLFWQSGYKLTITPESIIKERAIICIGYKWAGEKSVHSVTWDHNQDDKAMLEQFVPLMDEADELVTQNGDRFDIPWIRTRCMKHGIPMAPSYTSIDTKKEADRKMYLNSTRLSYMGTFLGLGDKLPTGGLDLWKRVLLNNDEAALRKMVRYCKRDVELLEQIWNKMNPYVEPKTHGGASVATCPECGSAKVIVNKRRRTASGYSKVCYQCNECGKYHTVAESRFEKNKLLGVG